MGGGKGGSRGRKKARGTSTGRGVVRPRPFLPPYTTHQGTYIPPRQATKFVDTIGGQASSQGRGGDGLGEGWVGGWVGSTLVRVGGEHFATPTGNSEYQALGVLCEPPYTLEAQRREKRRMLRHRRRRTIQPPFHPLNHSLAPLDSDILVFHALCRQGLPDTACFAGLPPGRLSPPAHGPGLEGDRKMDSADSSAPDRIVRGVPGCFEGS